MVSRVFCALSEDGYTLAIKRRTPAGVLTTTIYRDPDAGPFTDADVTAALSYEPRQMEPGQRSVTRRAVTRFGTLYTHVMTGPPTWWLPRVRRKKDGTVMAGWFRLAVAAWFHRAEKEGR